LFRAGRVQVDAAFDPDPIFDRCVDRFPIRRHRNGPVRRGRDAAPARYHVVGVNSDHRDCILRSNFSELAYAVVTDPEAFLVRLSLSFALVERNDVGRIGETGRGHAERLLIGKLLVQRSLGFWSPKSVRLSADDALDFPKDSVPFAPGCTDLFI
jgi:hypothetical protein